MPLLESCSKPSSEEEAWQNRLLTSIDICNDHLTVLLKLLAVSRDERGYANVMVTIQCFVPQAFEDRHVGDELALEIFKLAIENRVKEKLRSIESIHGYGWNADSSRLVAYWYGQEKPELPPALRYSPFVELRKLHYDPLHW
ncbi:hypothetical protein ANOM_010024 [Aspergillus nomiae NRRL 13137]|uniref:Uncharacterized protein n=1 Tax=Aspergillus nomiae NRRL (strain ATCC 15546 / NRRL 13137 / CBS 260.88 / M93) TaxID=1509407 RepID=A0A0L1IPJ7_ASPN3|nr:uncharacterized protein ANOM_010024 [Aspergillus nomiae NRRL 13137]KNG81461.1 hypothetical protein ANOM_010024 [Aspergillus nomiae NRRL 13137]